MTGALCTVCGAQVYLYFLESLFLSHSVIFYHDIKVFIMFYSCSASKESVQAENWYRFQRQLCGKCQGLQQSPGHSFSRSQSTEPCMFTWHYGCSRPSLNAGSLIQFCQVPILLRPLFIPLKSLVRDDTQQVRYNGKSTELVSQLARIALLQQSISDMWRCTFCNISILLVLRYMFLYKKQHIGDMLWCTSYNRIGSSKFNRIVCMYPVDIR